MAAAGLVGIGAGFGASELSKKAAKRAASRQRKFVRKMAETAYQRTMADMRAAGLNPILAYQRGPTPTGAVSVAHTPDYARAIAEGGATGAAVTQASSAKAQRRAQVQLMAGQIEVARTQSQLNRALTTEPDYRNALRRREALKTEFEGRIIATELPAASAKEVFDRSEAGQKARGAQRAADRFWRILGPLGGVGARAVTRGRR